MSAQAVLYLLGIALLVLSAVVPAVGRVTLLPLGLAVLAAGFCWPVISHG